MPNNDYRGKRMDWKQLVLYFIIGGGVVTAVTYFGGRGQGLLAAFLAMVPAVTLITIITIYNAGGDTAAVGYFKGLLIVLPAWLVYVVATMLLTPRIGLWWSLLIGVAAYIGLSMLIMHFVKG
jgi:hypothetical protein